jgi:hypothetical protein
MGIVSTWAAMRGLSLAEDVAKTTLGSHSPEIEALGRLDLIERKLDLLLDAPFRQAKMYLREGNLERCKEKVIEAISINELDLPALALYSILLRRSGRNDIATECYEDIVRKFGPHPDIVPDEIVGWFKEYCAQFAPVDATKGFTIIAAEDNYYPTDVWCSPWNIVSAWKHKERVFLARVLRVHQPRIMAHDWQGKRLFTIEREEVSIEGVTGEYALVRIDAARSLQVFGLSVGKLVPHLFSEEKIARLFSLQSPAVTRMQNPRVGTILPFGAVVIRVEEYGHSSYSNSYGRAPDATSGRLVVEATERSPNPGLNRTDTALLRGPAG